jgi:hypothetical protein
LHSPLLATVGQEENNAHAAQPSEGWPGADCPVVSRRLKSGHHPQRRFPKFSWYQLRLKIKQPVEEHQIA